MRSLSVFIAAGLIFIFNCASTYSIRSLSDEDESITVVSTGKTALPNTFLADDSDTPRTYLTQYSDLLEPVEIAQLHPATQNQPNAGKTPADTPAQRGHCPFGTGRACCVGSQLLPTPESHLKARSRARGSARGRQPPLRPVQGNCRWADSPGDPLSQFWCDDPAPVSAAGEQMPGYNDDPERAFRDKTGKDFCCEDIQSGVGIECDPLKKKSAITRESIDNAVNGAVNNIGGVLNNIKGAVGPVIENLPKVNPGSLIPDH